MRACAPNVLHTARLGSCRHKAEWAAAGTLPGSPATITGPWRTRRIFANHLRGTNFRPLNLGCLEDSPRMAGLHVFQGEEENQKFQFLTHVVLSGNCHTKFKLFQLQVRNWQILETTELSLLVGCETKKGKLGKINGHFWDFLQKRDPPHWN